MSQPATKTKVLHLITLSVVGGSQDNTFSTCELHGRARYEVHLASNPNGQWAERARAAGDFFHSIPSLVTPIRPLADLRAFLAILRLVRRERFDVVHTHTAKAGILGRLAAWLCRVPVVVHTYHAFPWHNFMPAWKRNLYVWLERRFRPLTHCVLTVSENERKEGIARGVFAGGASETAYSGIDFDKLDRPTDKLALRRSLGVPDDWEIVLMAGRLDPQKAPELMVRAMREVVRWHMNTMLVIAGDGELRPLVEATIREHRLEQNVRLLGFRNDVPDLLKIADVFALSSRWEGMGRAMTEAMLLGKPVVVPDINGIPEIVRHNETGVLYDVGNVEQLADGVRHLLHNPVVRERLGGDAQRLTRCLFDVRLMVGQIEEVYERLLPVRARGAEIVPLPVVEESEAPDAAASGGRR